MFLLKTDDKNKWEYAGKIISKKRIERPEKKDKVTPMLILIVVLVMWVT